MNRCVNADDIPLQVAEPLDIQEETICKTQDSTTVVYVTLASVMDDLSSKQKSAILENLSSTLSLKPQHVSLSQPRDLDRAAALVTGVGNISPAAEHDVVVSWIAGCGAVKSHHMDILETLETLAKGALGKRLGCGVSGWLVQSNKPKVSKRRLRRGLVTATPTPTTESISPGEIITQRKC